MNERVDFIKNEITKHRDNLEATRLELLEADKKRIENDTELLSEVNDLFAEIVDEGIVKWSDKPVVETTKISKPLWGYEEKERIISNYTPAKVYVYVPQPSDNSTQIPVRIYLRFNYVYGKNAYNYDSRSQDIHSYNQVTIAALNNEIFLEDREHHVHKSIPRQLEDKDKHLLESIVEGIKNPEQVRGFGSYEKPALSNPNNTLYQTK